MVIRFLGDSLDHYDKLIKELDKDNDIVKITISAFKYEEFGHVDGSRPTMEEVLTFMYCRQVHSIKDILQFDYEDIKILTDRERENLR